MLSHTNLCNWRTLCCHLLAVELRVCVYVWWRDRDRDWHFVKCFKFVYGFCLLMYFLLPIWRREIIKHARSSLEHLLFKGIFLRRGHCLYQVRQLKGLSCLLPWVHSCLLLSLVLPTFPWAGGGRNVRLRRIKGYKAFDILNVPPIPQREKRKQVSNLYAYNVWAALHALI